MRFLDINNFYDIECMTLYEYQLRMKAYHLKRIDREYDLYLSAWLNRAIKASAQKGSNYEYVYKTFTSFFDYEKQLQQVYHKKNQEEEKLKQIAKRQEEWRLQNGKL